MRAVLAIIMTLALIGHLHIVSDATAYEAFEGVSYVRGYLGYFVATALAFAAGSIAAYLAPHH